MINRITCIIILGIGFAGTYAYSQHQPFKGYVSVGTGFSTILHDKPFKTGNMIPFEFGIHANKEVNKRESFSIGLYYSFLGAYSRVTESTRYSLHSTYFGMSLKFISIPIEYYKDISLLKYHDSDLIFGIRTSLFYTNPTIINRNVQYYLDEKYFKDYLLSTYFGITVSPHKKFYIALKTEIFITPLVRRKYYDDFESEVEYFGSLLIPFKTIVSMHYNIDWD